MLVEVPNEFGSCPSLHSSVSPFAAQDFKTEKPNPFIRTFLLEYERMVGFLTFCKNHMSWKNVALDF